jgi:hypothetical protein
MQAKVAPKAAPKAKAPAKPRAATKAAPKKVLADRNDDAESDAMEVDAPSDEDNVPKKPRAPGPANGKSVSDTYQKVRRRPCLSTSLH